MSWGLQYQLAIWGKLREYLQHQDGCETWPSFPSHFTGASNVGQCTCGLTDLLAQLDDSPKPPSDPT